MRREAQEVQRTPPGQTAGLPYRGLRLFICKAAAMIKTTIRLSGILIQLVSVFAAVAWSNDISAAPAQVILLRHAEKPKKQTDRHLSEAGRARAQALASLLVTNNPVVSNLPPCALFAPKPSKDGEGLRAVETLEPLGARVGLGIQTPFSRKDHARLMRQLLHESDYEGKTVVVCWVHEYLNEMAEELGVSSRVAPWPKEVYDRIWVIKWVDNRAVLFEASQRSLAVGLKE